MRGSKKGEEAFVKLEAVIEWKQLMCLVLSCFSIIYSHKLFADHTSGPAFELLEIFSSIFQTVFIISVFIKT